MISNISGQFYEAVILQIMVPELADVSAADYEAKKLDKNGNVSTKTEDLRPFIVSHPKNLRMKVITWLGKEITWTFGAHPVLLKKIFMDPVPLEVDANGDVTATEVTSIQIGY